MPSDSTVNSPQTRRFDKSYRQYELVLRKDYSSDKAFAKSIDNPLLLGWIYHDSVDVSALIVEAVVQTTNCNGVCISFLECEE